MIRYCATVCENVNVYTPSSWFLQLFHHRLFVLMVFCSLNTRDCWLLQPDIYLVNLLIPFRICCSWMPTTNFITPPSLHIISTSLRNMLQSHHILNPLLSLVVIGTNFAFSGTHEYWILTVLSVSQHGERFTKEVHPRDCRRASQFVLLCCAIGTKRTLNWMRWLRSPWSTASFVLNP